MRSLTRTAFAAACTALLIPACSSQEHASSPPVASHKSPDSAATSSRPAGANIAWQSQGVRPLSGVTVTGDTGLLYAHGSTGLEVVAIDLKSGRTLWRRAAVPSGHQPGIAMHVATAGGVAAYYRGDMTGRAQVVFVDARTGAEKATFPAVAGGGAFGDLPSECDDLDDQICAVFSPDSSPTRVIMDPKSGQMRTDDLAEDSGQSISTDLERTTGTQLVHRVAGKAGWTFDTESSVGQGYSTDWGWDFRLSKTKHQYVGSLVRNAQDAPNYLARSAEITAVAIDERTGRLLWKKPGIDTYCLSDLRPADADAPLLACRWHSGEAASTIGSDDKPAETPGAMDVILLDPTTGSVKWSQPVGTVPSRWLKPTLSGGTVYLDTVQGRIGIDRRSGKKVSPTNAGWREKESRIDLPGYTGSSISSTYHGNDVWEAVTNGKPTPETSGWPIPSEVGSAHGSRRIVTTTNGVIAYENG